MAAERLQVILELVTGQYKKEAREAAASTKSIGAEAEKAGGGVSKMSGSMKLAAVAAAGFVATRIVGFLVDAAKAALEDNAAQVQLAVALENTVDATKAQVAATEDWITKTTRQTGITDNELRPALANLVRATGDLEVAQEQMGVAMDIATAKGLPLAAVTTAMGKAANGNVGAMGRLGLKVRDASGAFLDYNEILTEANRTMGGATTAAAESAEGQFRRMQVAVDEAKESIGNTLLPVLADLAEQGSDALQVMGFLGEKIGGLIPESNGFGSAIKEWLGPLGVSRKGFDLLADAIDRMDAVVEANNAQINVSADRYDIMAGSVDEATVALKDFEDEVRSQIDPMFNLISKVNDLDTAQANSATARDTYGRGSSEHQAALRKEAEAWLAVKDAQLRVAQESGITRDTYKQNLLDMQVFTREEIDLMLLDFDRVNGYVFADKTINVNTRGDVIGRERTTGARASGGPVTAGQMYRAGEGNRPELMVIPGDNGRILSNADTMALLRGGRGGQSLNITIAYPNHTGNDILAGVQRAVGLAGLVHFAEVTSGES